jgi:hypothetical protein
MVQFGAVFPCYSNKKATEFVLENFRKHFPENPIVLISDGGADFSYLLKSIHVIIIGEKTSLVMIVIVMTRMFMMRIAL